MGSASDVLDAVGHLLPSDQPITLCETLFEALKARRRKPVDTPPGDDAKQNQNSTLERLSWAREYKSAVERFEKPYVHALADGTTLSLAQRPFTAEGFASTVWDSAIVLAKALERLDDAEVAGVRACELGAGCGLPGLVMAARGAKVVLSDLADNLPLLEENCSANAHAFSAHASAPTTCALAWGASPPAACAPPFDLLLGTDLFYARDAMQLLVDTLAALSGPRTVVWLAAGRNRQAADEFWPRAEERFNVEVVPRTELDPIYQLTDVDVWRLRLSAE